MVTYCLAVETPNDLTCTDGLPGRLLGTALAVLKVSSMINGSLQPTELRAITRKLYEEFFFRPRISMDVRVLVPTYIYSIKEC